MILIFALVLAAQQSDKDHLCFAFAELGVATIEAYKAGVPLTKVLAYFDTLGLPAEVLTIFRRGVLKEYATPPKNIEIDRKSITEQFAAECLLTEFEH